MRRKRRFASWPEVEAAARRTPPPAAEGFATLIAGLDGIRESLEAGGAPTEAQELARELVTTARELQSVLEGLHG